GNFLTRAQRREGNARANSFAERHDVWLNAVLLVGEHGARAAVTGLYFVDNQQQLVLVGQCTQTLHEFLRNRNHAAFTLDRFQHDGDSLVIDQCLYRLQIVEHRLGEARHLRSKQRIPARFAGSRHGGERTTMEAVLHGDDLERAVAIQLTPFTSQLDGAFVGLSTTVGKENAVEAGSRGNALR